MSTESKKPMQFVLVASDDVKITVDEDVAFQSKLLEKMVADLGISDDKELVDLPISNVDGWTLNKILDWCKAHRSEIFTPKGELESQRITLTDKDKEYMDVTSDQLFNILTGANYLDIPGLIEIITQKIADMIDGKSVEEMRGIYGLTNDYTPDEEAEVKKRFEWVEA